MSIAGQLIFQKSCDLVRRQIAFSIIREVQPSNDVVHAAKLPALAAPLQLRQTTSQIGQIDSRRNWLGNILDPRFVAVVKLIVASLHDKNAKTIDRIVDGHIAAETASPACRVRR